MPPRTAVAESVLMFDRTVAGMGQRLLKVRAPAQMISALHWGMGELDQAFAGTSARVLARVACRAGCDSCCHGPVDVQAHEVFFAADHILVHFSPEALAEVIARLGAHRDHIATLTVDERAVSRSACALLIAGTCSIYAGRPEACRSHHTRDAAVCAAYLADPAVNLTKVYIPALRTRMFAVMLGLDEAIEAAGYDECSYDFGSALHEALTDSLCLVRWMRRESAFSDSCLSDAGVETRATRGGP
jgi:Fe-S-cluster containining protein